MLIRYRVFAGTLLFKAYLSVKEKENYKSITYREGWTFVKKLSFLFSRTLQQTLELNKLNKFVSLLFIKHFPSTFLQLVSSSKKSILSWVMKLDFFNFFFFFVFETPLKDFPFYSPILLTLWLGNLQTGIKEICMYLSSQPFFKTPHWTLKFQEKCVSQQSAGLHFKVFPLVSTMGPPHGAIELSKLKKLYFWGGSAIDKSAWIKACSWWITHGITLKTCEIVLFSDTLPYFGVSIVILSTIDISCRWF